ncbi:dynein regulatory complex subunit 5-like [Anabrus simplex]|uniref:dynein regulatory complex subunit 5-like n=1 Tax=Anabrus simplex TaxID=316456 RepID=UPI0035A2821B
MVEDKPLLDELLDEDRDFLLETLPIDLPLTLTVPLIPDGIYWERCCTERWQTILQESQESRHFDRSSVLMCEYYKTKPRWRQQKRRD